MLEKINIDMKWTRKVQSGPGELGQVQIVRKEKKALRKDIESHSGDGSEFCEHSSKTNQSNLHVVQVYRAFSS